MEFMKDDWTFRKLGNVIEARLNDMWQYFTVIDGKLLACDGLGNCAPGYRQAAYLPPKDVQNAMKRIG